MYTYVYVYVSYEYIHWRRIRARIGSIFCRVGGWKVATIFHYEKREKNEAFCPSTKESGKRADIRVRVRIRVCTYLQPYCTHFQTYVRTHMCKEHRSGKEDPTGRYRKRERERERTFPKIALSGQVEEIAFVEVEGLWKYSELESPFPYIPRNCLPKWLPNAAVGSTIYVHEYYLHERAPLV